MASSFVEEKTIVPLDNEDSEQLTLRTADGKQLVVAKGVAKLSGMINTALTNKDENELDLKEVTYPTLKIIMEFLEYHKDVPYKTIEKPLTSNDMTKLTSEWDAKFMERYGKDHDLVWDLIQKSNYLEVKGLLDLAISYTASLCKGKTPEEIRRTFNITKDFTPEEEIKVLEESKMVQ